MDGKQAEFEESRKRIMKKRWLIVTGIVSAIVAALASAVAGVLTLEKQRARRYIELQ